MNSSSVIPAVNALLAKVMGSARFAASISSLAIGCGANPGYSQDYPSKPIRIITTAAGGGGDFTTRLIAQGITGPLGQQIIVDNRVSGFLAAEAGAKSPPDGYNLTVGGGSTWITPLLTKAPYDVERDFAPISLIERSVQILVVHPSMPVKSTQELIALAKARPGDLNYAATSTAGSIQFSVELFKSMAGVNMVRVAYKGAAASHTGLIMGEVHMGIFDASVVGPHVKSGRMRALAVTSAEPSALVPGLPTVAAAGLPGYEWVSPTGIWTPAKTPSAIITRLNQEIVRAINRPDIKERFLSAGIEPVGNSPEQFAATIRSDIAKVGKIIKEAGIKVN